MGQQTVDAGYSYVIDVLNFVAHQFGGDYGFFGYGNVAGSGGDDYDYSLAVAMTVALEDDGSGQGTILGLARSFLLGILLGFFLSISECFGYGGVLLLGGASRQHVAAVGGQAREDFG